MVEVLALEIDFRAAEMRAQAIGEIERGGADGMLEIGVHLCLEGRIGLGARVDLLEVQDERHQRLGDEASAEHAEMTALVGTAPEGVRLLDRHAALPDGVAILADACRTERMKARILSGSFSPGARSTPEETSTPDARGISSAEATLPASSPPDSRNSTPASMLCSRFQSNRLPSPPGRVASRGGRASNSKWSATFA